MSNKVKGLSFVTAILFAFGLSALDFNNLSFEGNEKAYIALIAGTIFGIMYFRYWQNEKLNR
jgi:hypothetical protein